jgi:four helix bundle protein
MEMWQLSRELVNRIYDISGKDGFSKDFALRNQITKAGISIMSNIAEGYERKSNKEFIQFLFIAKGSSAEVRSQLYVALDREYITEKDFEELHSKAETISRSLSGMIKYLRIANK